MRTNKRLIKLSLISAFSVLCSLFSVLCLQCNAQETLTITTYYPSPTGSFNNLQANRLAVGDTNNDGNINSTDQANLDGNIVLRPHTDAPGTGEWLTAGKLGEIAFSSSAGVSQLYYSDGTNWNPLGGGRWTLTGTNLYPNNLTWNVGIGTNAPTGLLQVGTAFIVETGGNVGIGAMNPGRKLVVRGSTNNLHTVRFVANNDYGLALGGQTISGIDQPYGAIQSCDASGPAGDLILQLGGGNVGIGTDTPSAKLEVVGGKIKATDGLVIRVGAPATPEVGEIWLEP